MINLEKINKEKCQPPPHPTPPPPRAVFKKICPCIIIPHHFFNFSESPSLGEVTKFTPPFKKKGGRPNYASVYFPFLSLFIGEGRIWKLFKDSP